jgi:hypothetical protein
MSSILESDVFNTMSDEKSIPWRNLSNEERLRLLDVFFENFKEKIQDSTILMIKKSVEEGKLKTKKEITYDKINKKILSINALVLDDTTNSYVFNPTFLVKKEKKNIKNILFRN